MADIEVRQTTETEERYGFEVTVTEAGDSSRHEVTLSRKDFEAEGDRWDSPGDYVKRCFEFLLEREPKESILPSFDVGEIGTYFPEFRQGIV